MRFHYWWTAVSWYLKDKVKSNQVLNNILLTNWRQLMWINGWIIQWRRHMYHWWWKLIDIWVIFIAIKSPVTTRSFLWRTGWLLKNRRQLRWIDDWIIQWIRKKYHQWWQLIALLVTSLLIGSPVIMRIVPCSIFVATTNTL